MKFPQHILVIVGGKRKQHFALNRAVQLAKFYDIKLHLMSCVYDPGTDLSPLISQEHRKALKQEQLDNRLEYLNQLKAEVEKSNIPVTTQVIWHRKIQKAVMQACEDVKPDLVIKRISDKAPNLNPFTMPIDWQLLRHCPAPLLIVNNVDWKIPSPVLAAVDASADSSDEQAFNHTIIGYAKLLSRLTDAPAHVVTTHITPSLDNATTIPGFDLDSLKKEVNDFNQERLSGLVEEHNITKESLHIIEGLAEERIPQITQQIDAQIVVMGTVCRTGLSGAFMGNTAERVLTRLQCEVLALKPPKN